MIRDFRSRSSALHREVLLNTRLDGKELILGYGRQELQHADTQPADAPSHIRSVHASETKTVANVSMLLRKSENLSCTIMISMRKCLVTDGMKAGRVHLSERAPARARARKRERERERERECGYVSQTHIPADSQQTILGP